MDLKLLMDCKLTSSQAPSYASPKLSLTHLLARSLTGVKCRATSVAKKVLQTSSGVLVNSAAKGNSKMFPINLACKNL